MNDIGLLEILQLPHLQMKQKKIFHMKKHQRNSSLSSLHPVDPNQVLGIIFIFIKIFLEITLPFVRIEMNMQTAICVVKIFYLNIWTKRLRN